jgi:acetoacetyl-CoA synthetase
MERLAESEAFVPTASPERRSVFHRPDEARSSSSQMTRFARSLERLTGRSFNEYEALHRFSVSDYRVFWRHLLQCMDGIEWAGQIEPVCTSDEIERATFFPGVELSYAANVLGKAIADDDAPALTSCHATGESLRLTRGELRERVARLAHALAKLGLHPGDRVVGVMRNDAQAVIAALAVSALGATLSTAAPEMGAESLIDRFAPLEPRLLFAHTATREFDRGLALSQSIETLVSALPSLDGIVSLDDMGFCRDVKPWLMTLDEVSLRGDAQQFTWPRFAFNHPLFIMFSSGTTGKPKCIVHGAGGTLLEHLKEHRLHCDLRPAERMYFHTSCAWMMWNWQLSALASGVEIVMYDGPIASIDTLWQLVANERVNVFGTSPGYLRMCQTAGLSPAQQFDLAELRAIMSTGAVLYDDQYAWVREHVKPLALQSISGGTDILGCFVLANPWLPVYAGEAQCKGLGFDIQSWEDSAPVEGIGELVCVKPFPSRPLGFYGDTDGTAFHRAYFSANPGVWTHGDLVEFTRAGTARMHGRSDGLLNVRGINVGPDEIYRVLNDIAQIREAIVVQQRLSAAREPTGGEPSAADQRTVLLLVLSEGVTLTSALHARIRRELARRASAVHVPDRIIAVDELPVTHNGKLSETAARCAVNGVPVGNSAALRNPECLDRISRHPGLHPETRLAPAVVHTAQDLERMLRVTWERLFEFAPIGRDDNFFELGGNSLTAARMLAEAQQVTGRSLPLSTLLIAPTIRQLATLLNLPHARALAGNLVELRSGSGKPVFLMHGASGTVMECWTLAGALHSARPVYGLQASGLDGEIEPQKSVEAMAENYIDHLRKIQPLGPYVLAGYSLGGLIALEVAQQLVRRGERIELVCVVDSYVHERCLPIGAWMKHYGRCAGDQLNRLRAVHAAQLPIYLRQRLAGAADLVRMRAGHLARRPERHNAGLPPLMLRVREAMRVAMTRYRPKPYRGSRIVFLRAQIPLPGRGDPLPLWHRIARAGLTVTDIPGDHNGLVLEPNVAHVAAALSDALERA